MRCPFMRHQQEKTSPSVRLMPVNSVLNTTAIGLLATVAPSMGLHCLSPLCLSTLLTPLLSHGHGHDNLLQSLVHWSASLLD